MTSFISELRAPIEAHRTNTLRARRMGINAGPETIVFMREDWIDAGEKLDWKRPIVADKHSVGGIAGIDPLWRPKTISAALRHNDPEPLSRSRRR